MTITISLNSGMGKDLGPTFNLTANVGSVSPATATKSELLLGKIVTVSDSATQVTITSTGNCTNSLTLTIGAAPTTTTTTTTAAPTTTTTTTTAAPTTTTTTTTTTTAAPTTTTTTTAAPTTTTTTTTTTTAAPTTTTTTTAAPTTTTTTAAPTTTTTTTTTTTAAPTFSLTWAHTYPGTGTSTFNIYVNGTLTVNSSTSGGGPYSGTITGLTSADAITYSLFGTSPNFTKVTTAIDDNNVGIIETLTDCNMFSANVSNTSGITLSTFGSISAITEDYIDGCP